jgi:hypothetical protein
MDGHRHPLPFDLEAPVIQAPFDDPVQGDQHRMAVRTPAGSDDAPFASDGIG